MGFVRKVLTEYQARDFEQLDNLFMERNKNNEVTSFEHGDDLKVMGRDWWVGSSGVKALNGLIRIALCGEPISDDLVVSLHRTGLDVTQGVRVAEIFKAYPVGRPDEIIN